MCLQDAVDSKGAIMKETCREVETTEEKKLMSHNIVIGNSIYYYYCKFNLGQRWTFVSSSIIENK